VDLSSERDVAGALRFENSRVYYEVEKMGYKYGRESESDGGYGIRVLVSTDGMSLSIVTN
jgi:hypothetical protein